MQTMKVDHQTLTAKTVKLKRRTNGDRILVEPTLSAVDRIKHFFGLLDISPIDVTDIVNPLKIFITTDHQINYSMARALMDNMMMGGTLEIEYGRFLYRACNVEKWIVNDSDETFILDFSFRTPLDQTEPVT